MPLSISEHLSPKLHVSSRPNFSGHRTALTEGSWCEMGSPCTAPVTIMWKQGFQRKSLLIYFGFMPVIEGLDVPLNSNMEFKITDSWGRWHLWQINCEYISLNKSHLKHFDNMRHCMEVHLRFVNTEHSTQYRLIKIHILHKLRFSQQINIYHIPWSWHNVVLKE